MGKPRPECRRKVHYRDHYSARVIAEGMRTTEEGRPHEAFKCCPKGWGVRLKRGRLTGQAPTYVHCKHCGYAIRRAGDGWLHRGHDRRRVDHIAEPLE